MTTAWANEQAAVGTATSTGWQLAADGLAEGEEEEGESGGREGEGGDSDGGGGPVQLSKVTLLPQMPAPAAPLRAAPTPSLTRALPSAAPSTHAPCSFRNSRELRDGASPWPGGGWGLWQFLKREEENRVRDSVISGKKIEMRVDKERGGQDESQPQPAPAVPQLQLRLTCGRPPPVGLELQHGRLRSLVAPAVP